MRLRLFTLTASALALTMATASAQSGGGDTLDMTDWDRNDDSRLSPQEFTAGHELSSTPRDDYFGDASMITEDRFVEGEFARYDLDDDEVWTEEEFLASEETWRTKYPDADFDTWAFDEFDVNADDVIDRNEFDTLWSRRADLTVDGEPIVATYDAYDRDASGDITAGEFAEGDFARYDLDNDGMIDEEEFSLWRGTAFE